VVVPLTEGLTRDLETASAGKGVCSPMDMLCGKRHTYVEVCVFHFTKEIRLKYSLKLNVQYHSSLIP